MKKIIFSITLVVVMIPLISFGGEDDKIINSNAVSVATISGSVLDQLSGESLGGAEIEIIGTDIKSYSDFDGNFSIVFFYATSYAIISTVRRVCS